MCCNCQCNKPKPVYIDRWFISEQYTPSLRKVNVYNLERDKAYSNIIGYASKREAILAGIEDLDRRIPLELAQTVKRTAELKEMLKRREAETLEDIERFKELDDKRAANLERLKNDLKDEK